MDGLVSMLIFFFLCCSICVFLYSDLSLLIVAKFLSLFPDPFSDVDQIYFCYF